MNIQGCSGKIMSMSILVDIDTFYAKKVNLNAKNIDLMDSVVVDTHEVST